MEVNRGPYLVIVDEPIANPHERDEEEIDLADNAALNSFVPWLSIVRDDRRSNVFRV